jgi:UDPglucose--hexose-1-phosphate uridylyltransferase
MVSAGPELRKDRLEGRWVIFAPERMNRPHDARVSPRPSPPRSCPFCPGNEGGTPPEIAALRARGSRPDGRCWRVRVIPNKFPAVRPDAGKFRSAADPSLIRPAKGIHEVVIDTPRHGREWPDLGAAAVRDVLRVCRDRVAAAERTAGIRHVQMFKNKGFQAGASLSHAHTQIIGLPLVPDDIRREALRSAREFRREGRCPVCRMLETERAEQSRWIAADRHFAVLAPFASRFPFQTRIYPLRHSASFSRSSEAELLSLAVLARSILARLKRSLDDPPYNIILRQPPRPAGPEASKSGHWSLEIVPVLAHIAGFELGTGMFINPVLPEEAARELRR